MFKVNISNPISSRSQVLDGIDVLKNYAKLTGKHLCWSVFLIKLQASNLCSATLIKAELSLSKKTCFICLNESPLKMIKNA